eukprot:TRINITY_DN4942_c0_g1_i2.p1 TRINITY_DN4942_c0_g1~~TRINITY_DN4942_c0_g1_i2.p1  ORF type:complete len:442 (+),score=98.21 TRINITY_DN4942_c0_g1_i2:36-1361(+)
MDSRIQQLSAQFPGLSDEIIQSVLSSSGNFEQAVITLSEMCAPSTLNEMTFQASNETKLSFLKLVFDQLDHGVIHAALLNNKWSVEGALDPLLRAEEERTRLEIEKRKREEELRKKKEQEERARLEQEKKRNEMKTRVQSLTAMFPHIDKNFISDTAQSPDFNMDTAIMMLSQIEQERVEVEKKRLRQEEYQRKTKEKAELERQAKLKVEIASKDELKRAFFQESTSNWTSSSSSSPFSKPTDGTGDLSKEREAMINITSDIVPNLTKSEITKIFQENGWNIKTALPSLEKSSLIRMQQKLALLFPFVDTSMLNDIVAQAFPDEFRAVSNLSPIQNYEQNLVFQNSEVQLAKKNLDEAIKRSQALNQTILNIKADRAKQDMLLNASVYSIAEKQMLKTAQDLVRQRVSQVVQPNGTSPCIVLHSNHSSRCTSHCRMMYFSL